MIGRVVGRRLMAFGFLHSALENAGEQAAHLAATGGTTTQLTGVTHVVLWGFVGALLGLIAATLLSLYKPGGKTRRGRRLDPARHSNRPAREPAPR
jgi:hypothetical protein